MNVTKKNSIHSFILNNRQNIVDMLSGLVKIPSVKGECVEGAIYGSEVRDAILHTARIYSENSLKTEVDKDTAFTVGKTDGDDKVIGIFSHADVVAAVEEDWQYTKPFEPLEKDGFLIGRGAEDNKSGIVAGIWALKAMKHADAMPQSTLMFYAGGDEECGMSDLDRFVQSYPMPDVSIVPDNDFPVCRGEKGIMRMWASFRKPFQNIISIKGGQSLNIVLGKVKCVLKYSPALYRELESFCKGKGEYTLIRDENIVLTAYGKSTHAAYSENSVNALFVLINALSACPSLDGDRELLKNIQALVTDPYMDSIGLGTEDKEFKKTTCTNGIVDTTNGCIKLSFDTRYGTEIDINCFVDSFAKHLDTIGADCEVTEKDDGYVIPSDSPIIEAMSEAWHEVTGKDKTSVLSYGGTYARYLKNAVSIGTHTRITPHLEMPQGHGGVHQPDEVIDIDGLLEGIEILTHMIIRADETLHAQSI